MTNLSTLIFPAVIVLFMVFSWFSERKRKEAETKKKEEINQLEVGSSVIFQGSLVGVIVGIEDICGVKTFIIKSGSFNYQILTSGINSILMKEISA